MQSLLFLSLVLFLAEGRSIKTTLEFTSGTETPSHLPQMSNDGQTHGMESNLVPDTPDPKQYLDTARFLATQRLMQKMLQAFGKDLVESDFKLPENASISAVEAALDTQAFECPDSFIRCSQDIYFSSCDPPASADPELWDQRLNLFFDLPNDLLERDQLLYAPLKIYKNGTLPIPPSSNLHLELFVYSRGLTKQYDINFHYDTVIVRNDYIGWVTFNVTELIREMNFTAHHGFLLRTRESLGVYWNAPNLIASRDCSNDSTHIFPVPFGIVTDKPEMKYPSLTIETGTPYSETTSDSTPEPDVDQNLGFYDMLRNHQNPQQISSGMSEIFYDDVFDIDKNDLDTYLSDQEVPSNSNVIVDENRKPILDIDIEEDEEVVPSMYGRFPVKKHHFHIKTYGKRDYARSQYDSTSYSQESRVSFEASTKRSFQKTSSSSTPYGPGDHSWTPGMLKEKVNSEIKEKKRPKKHHHKHRHHSRKAHRQTNESVSTHLKPKNFDNLFNNKSHKSISS